MSITEVQTRQQRIDRQLDKAGWSRAQRNILEEVLLPMERKRVGEGEQTYQVGNEFADYVLMGKNSKPMAVLEAKRSSRDPLVGERQATDYADRILHEKQGDPFVYLANGEKVWFLDRERFPVREVSGFHSPDDLERLAFQRRYSQPLAELGPSVKIVDRSYQFAAIKSVTETLEKGHRRFLLVMATGTGKTRTTIALIELLMRTKWVQRVLFLADRRELARQALSAFKEHLPHESRDRIEGGEINHGARIHVATYPSMIQVYEQLSVGYYDLIIADESHRSIYNRYKAIFDHFDALVLGLTATPTDYIDHNTFQLFNCQDGKPTYQYGYESAVEDGHLAQYLVVESKTHFQVEGIKAGQLPEDIQRQLLEQGVDLSDINFEGTGLERRVTNVGTNQTIVNEIIHLCRKDASGTLPAKTIIFAMSHAHALELYKAFNVLYPEWQRRGLARVIDSQMERADTILDDFKFRDMPRIAISVDMLDTGIDVPSAQNLIFAKPVFSQVKFWQMIGRGTRLWVDPQNSARKTDFFILDFWDNFAYFNLNPQGEPVNAETPLPVHLFRLRLEKLVALRGIGQSAQADATVTQLQAMLAEIPAENINVRAHTDELKSWQRAESWTLLTPERLETLSQTLAPLLRFLPDVNLKGMSFEARVEQLALAYLNGDTDKVNDLRLKVQDDLTRLPPGLPEVQALAEKIAWVQSEGFWEYLDYARIMNLQSWFASVMRYRETQTRQIIHLNLPDKIVNRLWIAYGPAGEGAFAQTYREQVEARVRDLAEQHPVFQKLQQGKSLSEDDFYTLTVLLNQADLFVTETNLRQAYQQPDAQLMDFLRHILGQAQLPNQEEEIGAAFDQFIAAHPHYRASQIQFLRLVRAYAIRRARLSTQDFYRLPFARLGQADRLFSIQELDEILAFANQFAR